MHGYDNSHSYSRTYQNYDETLPVMKSESTSKAIEDERYAIDLFFGWKHYI